MPILVDRGTLGWYSLQGASYAPVGRISSHGEGGNRSIRVGLLNNMPDAALQATEQQFIKLLDSASREKSVHLQLFSLSKIRRTDWGRGYLERSYHPISDLRDNPLDGLIITGTEPLTCDLRNEPYWTELADVFDWANHNTISTICSCLATHAAVLHADGIGRIALTDKCFGVFEQTKVSDHPILENMPARFSFPHSRWNGLDPEALAARGYTILTESSESGVDSFAKQLHSLFVYFQGHPEYEARSLLGEYRRDIGRFLRRECDRYPSIPCGYFDDEATAALKDFEKRAIADRREEMLTSFPTMPAIKALQNTWLPTADLIYSNWLSYISDRKSPTADAFDRASA
jgi:homoserine O-succinyltransferase/O-acetyltransferase